MPKKAASTVAPKAKYSYKKKPISKATKAVATRKATGYKYPGAGAKIGRAIGGAFGPVGAAAGGLLGDLAHTLVHKVTGFGDYSLPNFDIAENKLLETNDPPVVINNGKEFIIRHREYVGDLYSGVAGSSGAPAPTPFTNRVFNLNPGLLATFPWLHQVAKRFEQYKIEGMLWEFKSMYSDAAVQTGGSLGSVIMATEYNAAKPAFASKIEMENYEFAQSSKPSVSMCHPIECAPDQTPIDNLYVRSDSLSLVDQDVKMYDLGTFQIASQGIPCSGSALSLGEIWISYQIKFLKPRVSDYVDSGYARFSSGPVSQPSGSKPFDPAPGNWSQQANNLGVALVDNDTFSVPLFPNARTYMVVMTVFDPSNGNSQAAAVGYFTGNPPTYVNGSSVSLAAINQPSSTVVVGGVNTSGSSYVFYFKADAVSPGKTTCEVTLPSTGIGASLTVMKNLIVNAVPNTA